MAKNKKPLPIYEQVTIADCAAEGKCVVRIDDKVVFVPFVVPGDVVDLQVRKKRKSYCEAEVIRLRYGLVDGRCHTLEEVGLRFDVTRERIRQIEAKALRKLRQFTRRSKLNGYTY